MKNELLAKYILGEVNMKEGQRVEQWLEESEDHQREFRQLKRRIELGSKRYKYGVFALLPKSIFPSAVRKPYRLPGGFGQPATGFPQLPTRINIRRNDIPRRAQ